MNSNPVTPEIRKALHDMLDHAINTESFVSLSIVPKYRDDTFRMTNKLHKAGVKLAPYYGSVTSWGPETGSLIKGMHLSVHEGQEFRIPQVPQPGDLGVRPNAHRHYDGSPFDVV